MFHRHILTAEHGAKIHRTISGLQDVDGRVQKTRRSAWSSIWKINFCLSLIRTAGCGVQNSRMALCPNLEVLCVKYSPKVTDKSMWEIAINCPSLKELDISCCYKISSECIKMVV
ncbi:unnamed protein product [Microthlaspi erraticum]|uniref:Uncharacterized protein n=1 Tax=Microthlaspi erraticum TaxID=1685480 RepID=A0A6D2KNY1_9BRAS|nr:unnamed protein product [Microthlaspi erraticum]CAA7056262.1 unnamed protein product [Microthlaspi erraticum]